MKLSRLIPFLLALPVLVFAAESKAVKKGAFVWADANDMTFDPYGLSGPQGITNSFNVRATGGFPVYLPPGPTPMARTP